ncbi:S41 family peptidase [Marinilongibacter aquaticus]|uniref:S41 family peptidase n=1 Tax=Marinilongibacter aquaticus TaxID=2975157 RepID=UPI0021BDBECC|nr:S41 family peptidase [Marinilongibacter aquaticus]UBM58319.1 S41 family peptidase [Marinilongibacter aquaticus]
MNRVRKYLVGLLLVSCVVLVGFRFDDRYFEIAKNLDIFASLYKELNALYVDELNPSKTMQTGINAMLENLDPYTNFYTEDLIEDYRTLNAGKYNGIGATVNEKLGEHTVVMVYQYSPADEAGIKIGDVITHINGVSVEGRDIDEMSRLLKGQTGTKVDLTVKRFGERKPLKLEVRRDVVQTPNVPHYGLVDAKTGYIQLNDFSATAASEIKSAFDELKGQGMQSLILDLRGNPGGLLNQAIEICNFFLPKGELIVETKGKLDQWNTKYESKREPVDLEIPIAVLINGSSASASEIVSGTLQDYDRAVLIGQRSFGKGLVQTTRRLSFNTQLKVTTAKYYIPSGRCIQAIDYSHRNADGSVGKMPDSLRSTFYTKNRRPVKDGGGVDPDIDLEPKLLSTLTSELIEQGLLFDFATRYFYENQEAVPENGFVPDDKTFASFKAFVEESGFKYEDEATLALDQLDQAAKSDEAYGNLEADLQMLRNRVEAKSAEDWTRYKEEIKNELALEILSRYHYDKVMKFVSFEKDQEVQKALEILKDQNAYQAILKGK